MTKKLAQLEKKTGAAPGTLIYVGEQRDEVVDFEVVEYSKEDFSQKTFQNLGEIKVKTGKTFWLNVCGIHEMKTLQALGEKFELHALVLEDIANTHQRPKFEEFEDHIFLVVKVITHENSSIQEQQISLIIAKNQVLSFQETENEIFENLVKRIKKPGGKIRTRGSDYLAYAILDIVVDNYFLVLEKIGEELEALEDEVLTHPSPEFLGKIQKVKRDLIAFRKSVWPLREVVARLQQDESSLFKKGTGIFLRDLYDHTIQSLDTIESSREIASSLLDIYLSSVSNRMNEVMKVLTIFAAIFIPLTFIAGVYGMNFEFMPELSWRWGYLVWWVVILSITAGMVWIFRRKKWF